MLITGITLPAGISIQIPQTDVISSWMEHATFLLFIGTSTSWVRHVLEIFLSGSNMIYTPTAC